MITCKKCTKPKSNNSFYKHPLTRSGYMGKCKECILAGRRTEHERRLARDRDRIRYKKSNRRKLYLIWKSMHSRCYNPGNSHYKRYGARGIKVEWKDFDVFYNDVISEYEKHGSKHGYDRANCQIDRIDNRGNYSTSNCRFVTAKENCANRS